MAKQLLVDTLPIKVSVVEDKGGGKIGFRGEFAKADVPTSNNRLYPRKLMERELKRVQKRIKERRFFGELDHPGDGKTQLQRAAMVVTKLEMNDAGIVVGEAECLNTSKGKDLAALLKDGCTIGVSSRGYGSLKTNTEGRDVVQEDYTLAAFDAVADPADADALPEAFDVPEEATISAPEVVEVVASGKNTDSSLDSQAVEAAVRGAVSATFEALSRKETEMDKVAQEEVAQEEVRDEDAREEAQEPETQETAESEAQDSNREEASEDSGEAASEEEDVETPEGDSVEEMRRKYPKISVKAAMKKAGIKEPEAGMEGVEAEDFDLPESVDSDILAQKEEEIARLREQLEKLKEASKAVAFEFYLEKALKDAPARDHVLKVLGDPMSFATVEDLQARVEEISAAFEAFEAEVRNALQEEAEQRDSEVKAIAEEVEQKFAQAAKREQELLARLSEAEGSAEDLREENKNLRLRLYIEEKLAHDSRSSQIKALIEEANVSSEEEVDAIVERFHSGTAPKGREALEQVRARVRSLVSGGVDVPERAVVESSDDTNYNGLNVSAEELAALAGITSNR